MNEDKKSAVEVNDLAATENVVEAKEKETLKESNTVKTDKPKAKPSAPGAAVSGADTDTVYLSKCVFKNMYARKSLTVHHVQRRLAELGYADAATDKDGWYGDLTALAVKNFQADNKLDGDGMMNAVTFVAIFDGDSNVAVDLDN